MEISGPIGPEGQPSTLYTHLPFRVPGVQAEAFSSTRCF